VFGVIGLILMGGFVADAFLQLQEATIHSQIGHIQIHKSGYRTQGRREPYKYLLKSSQELIVDFEAWPEVAEVMMRLGFSGLSNNGRANYPIIGEGVEPDKEARMGSLLSIVEGRQITHSDKFGILIGKGVAQALLVKPGDFITLLANTAGGALNSLEFEVIGVFQSFSKDFDNRAVRILLTAAQELLATHDTDSIVFSLKATDASDAVVSRLKKQLPEGQFEVAPWYELADFYQKTVDLYRRQFGVLEAVILVMVLLSVANTVNMALYERTGEFGTLKALGNRPRDLFRLIMLEYTLIGLIGGGIGSVLGILLAWIISSIGIPMPPMPNSDLAYTAHISIVPEVIAVAFAVGVVGTILAAVIPALRVSRMPVIDALRANV